MEQAPVAGSPVNFHLIGVNSMEAQQQGKTAGIHTLINTLMKLKKFLKHRHQPQPHCQPHCQRHCQPHPQPHRQPHRQPLPLRHHHHWTAVNNQGFWEKWVMKYVQTILERDVALSAEMLPQKILLVPLPILQLGPPQDLHHHQQRRTTCEHQLQHQLQLLQYQRQYQLQHPQDCPVLCRLLHPPLMLSSLENQLVKLLAMPSVWKRSMGPSTTRKVEFSRKFPPPVKAHPPTQ